MGQAAWTDFELEVLAAVQDQVSAAGGLTRPNQTRVVHRPRYFSAARGSDIEFDIAVETRLPHLAEPSLRWIVECKSYAQKRVPVDDLEEFYEKLNQVGIGNVIGSVVARAGFQAGAIKFAEARRISLCTLDKQLVHVTCFAEAHPGYDAIEYYLSDGVMPNGRRISGDDKDTLAQFCWNALVVLGALTMPAARP